MKNMKKGLISPGIIGVFQLDILTLIYRTIHAVVCCSIQMFFHFYYLHQCYVTDGICLTFDKITQKFMTGFKWHFQEMLGLGRGG